MIVVCTFCSLLNLSNITVSLAITYHDEEQEVEVPEWETGDKGEGKTASFAAKSNISRKGLGEFQTEMEGAGG